MGINIINPPRIRTAYGLVWGASQLVTGPLSDKIGRKALIVWGMWLCGLGVLALPLTLWSIESAMIGIGMAMLLSGWWVYHVGITNQNIK